jgi:DUF2934 family protein
MARSTKTTPTAFIPGDDDIARRAFELYCARGCEDGHDVEDWLQAERELREVTAAVESRPRRVRKPRLSEPRLAEVGGAAGASA